MQLILSYFSWNSIFYGILILANKFYLAWSCAYNDKLGKKFYYRQLLAIKTLLRFNMSKIYENL